MTTDDRLKLHIVVNDEIIDLRQENFDKTRTVKPRIPHRTTSQQLISNSSSRGGLNNRESLPVNGLKKLANNLYYGTSNAVLQKHKSTIRNKQRNRATSADPRFRRERSPVQKHATVTQSESQVTELQTDTKKNKSQSDSRFIIGRQASQSLTPLLKPVSKFTEEKTDPIKSIKTFHTSSMLMEDCNELRNGDAVKKESHEKNGSAKCGADGQNFNAETANAPPNAEQSTMTDELTAATTIDCKSTYQTAVTNVNFGRNSEIEVFNASMDYGAHKPKQLSPYWDDPRLLEKYGSILKPIRVKKSKSSWTLPLASLKPQPQPEPVVAPRVCSKCTCTHQEQQENVIFETCTDITEGSLNYEKTKTKIYNAMFRNYYLTAFFLLGSICGLMLVALIVWVLANDLLWTYLNRSQESPKYTGIRWLTAYIGGGILYGISFVCNKIYHMIVLPRNEVFDPMKEEAAWSIF